MGVKLICNNKGEHFMEHLLTKMTGYVPITHFVAEEIAKGGGSENGAVYIDLTAPDAHLYERPTYFRNVELWKKELGIDVMEPGHLVEIGIEAFEHLGQPAVDDKMMSTELPGLFNVRGAGNSVMIHSNHWFAPYTGHCACEYASSNSDIGEIDLSGVKSEIERLQSILNAEGTKRPHEIRHAIQHAFYEAMYAGTDAEKLQKAIDELERIKTEDLPEMYVSNKSLVWNSEWKQAIENYNILELAEASLKATLMREESRIFFYRHDFPEPDDENWLAHIKVKQVDGKMEFEKVPVVQ